MRVSVLWKGMASSSQSRQLRRLFNGSRQGRAGCSVGAGMSPSGMSSTMGELFESSITTNCGHNNISSSMSSEGLGNDETGVISLPIICNCNHLCIGALLHSRVIQGYSGWRRIIEVSSQEVRPKVKHSDHIMSWLQLRSVKMAALVGLTRTPGCRIQVDDEYGCMREWGTVPMSHMAADLAFRGDGHRQVPATAGS